MTNNIPFHATPNSTHQRFQQKVEQLRQQSRTLTGLVRALYQTIEQAIEDGVPLEALLVTLNEEHGMAGSMHGFKSALYRIRKEVDARRTLGCTTDLNVALFPGNANSVGGVQPYLAPGQHQPFQPMQFPAQPDQMNMPPHGQPIQQWPAPQPGFMYVQHSQVPGWGVPHPQSGYRPTY